MALWVEEVPGEAANDKRKVEEGACGPYGGGNNSMPTWRASGRCQTVQVEFWQSDERQWWYLF